MWDINTEIQIQESISWECPWKNDCISHVSGKNYEHDILRRSLKRLQRLDYLQSEGKVKGNIKKDKAPSN